MSEPSVALQTALGAALKGVCSCPVYDGVPQDVPYPYVVMDDQTITNSDLLATRLDMRFVYLSVWSRQAGQAEVMGIMAEIDTLNETPLDLSTGQMVSLRVERKRAVREPDNLTFQGQVTLRIYTTH